MDQIFETERLWLRPTVENDAPFLFELLNSPNWLQYIGDRKITSEEKAAEYVQLHILPQRARLGYSNYTIFTKEDDIPIGTVGLYDRKGLEGIDIGFAILPTFEQRGFISEAAHKIISVAFHEFGLSMVSGITTEDNIPSQKILKKIGLKFMGMVALPDSEKEFLFYQLKR